MIERHSCKMCGGWGEGLTAFEGCWYHEECLGENEVFQEYESQMEHEIDEYRRTPKGRKFFNDLAYSEKHIVPIQKKESD